MGEYIMDIVTLAASRKYTDKKIMESGAVGIKYEIVDSLPSSGEAQIIYFVKNNNSLINDYYDEYVWISTSNAFEKIGSTQIDGSTTQPDWNQNDATQPDYIKNRPFYTGDPVETVLVEESTVAFQADGGIYVAVPQLTFDAIVGDTYKVSWDGTIYESTCMEFQEVPVIGNLSIMGIGSDTGEPFLAIIQDGILVRITTTDTASSHTISISWMAPPIIKIDEKYLPLPSKPKGTSYLTFSSPHKFTLGARVRKVQDRTLEYFASDKTWATWNGESALSAVYNGGEYAIYLRGTGNSVLGISLILSGTDIKCIGNIENLLDYATVESGNHPVMGDECYYEMFSDCTSLIQAPDLPATTLTKGCYEYMFSNCTSLIQAPNLPATTLADSCYFGMFHGCTSLTQIFALPATTLVERCYMYMFRNCTSLKLSSTRTDKYVQEYRIPSSGNGVTIAGALDDMFVGTGGTFTGTPEINTTYYLSSDNMIVRETEIATLNGYVGSMINTALSAIGIAEEGAY